MKNPLRSRLCVNVSTNGKHLEKYSLLVSLVKINRIVIDIPVVEEDRDGFADYSRVTNVMWMPIVKFTFAHRSVATKVLAGGTKSCFPRYNYDFSFKE